MSNNGAKRILVLDGGMGTTLEDEFDVKVGASALWSSTLLESNEGFATLRKLHQAFIDAGADLIETCTYSASFEAFKRQGIEAAEARHLSQKAVATAVDCCKNTNAKIVLALSCYGSSLSPSQDYTGDYPPPFGPPSSTSTDCLADWHYQRLRIYADDAPNWEKIAYIAMETIPILNEAVAIRRAFAKLEQEKISLPPWYISFVFPDGLLPGGKLDVSEVVTRTLTPRDNEAIPTGMGVNCTKLNYLPKIVEGLTDAVASNNFSPVSFLALYPDGGLTYEPVTKTWHGPAGVETQGEAAVPWAQELLQVATVAASAKDSSQRFIWGQVFVGGCCKTGPAHIAALAKHVARL